MPSSRFDRRTLEGITGDFAGFWRSLVAEDQLRWLRPEKGVMHLAAGTESATVQQHPSKIGSLGIATLYAAVRGKKVPKNVDTGTGIVTK
jgi:hypothetical protein